MNVIGLSDKHEANLRKLAAYLLVAGNLKAKFTMGTFSDMKEPDTEATDCGAVGCAVGHGPYAGIEKLPGEDWSFYSDRVFGLDDIEFEAEWEWCFCSRWSERDDTPQGAAKRILWLLDKGLPEDHDEQKCGEADLCY